MLNGCAIKVTAMAAPITIPAPVVPSPLKPLCSVPPKGKSKSMLV